MIIKCLVVLFIFVNNTAFAQLSSKNQELLDSYLVSAKDFESKNDAEKAASQYYKAGLIYMENGMYKESIPLLKLSANLNISVKKYKEVQNTYSNLGLIYMNSDDLENAMVFFASSLKIRTALGKKDDIASGVIDIAYVLSAQKSYKESILKLVEALDMATEIKHSRLILICYRMLADNYKNLGDMQKSSEYESKFSTYKDYSKNKENEKEKEDEKIKNIVAISEKDAEARTKQLELELYKKNKEAAEDSLKRIVKAREDSLLLADANAAKGKTEIELLEQGNKLNQSKLEEQKARQKFQQTIIYAGIGIVALICIIAIVLWLSGRRSKLYNKKLEERNKEVAFQKKNIEIKNEELSAALLQIEEQNKNIAHNIKYARNIQKAILPKQENLNNFIKEAFIFFEPREKVSGDFFWFNEVPYTNGTGIPKKKFFISAVDCTGHGVSGALLSMVSYNLLDDIVFQKKILQPNLILNELHKGIRKTLRQQVNENQEGMDMALCSFDAESNILEYAGAKNPLIYIKNNELVRLKGDGRPVGGTYYEKIENKSFTHNSVEIDSPTACYIFSDGFSDQVGEKNGKKMMSSQFRDLLYNIHLFPMTEQREIIKKTFFDWKGNTEQIDDVLVMGFKLFPQNKID